MNEIRLVVFGDVAAEARARHSTMRRGRPYTPPNTVAWRLILREEALKHRQEPLWDGPIGLEVTTYKRAPKSDPKRKYNTAKPDCDNWQKLAQDALSGIIFTDDCRIVDARTVKLCGDPPRMEVRVWKMERRRAG